MCKTGPGRSLLGQSMAEHLKTLGVTKVPFRQDAVQKHVEVGRLIAPGVQPDFNKSLRRRHAARRFVRQIRADLKLHGVVGASAPPLRRELHGAFFRSPWPTLGR